MHCETETEVINVLKSAELWDNNALWVDFGDTENNFATIGNQQSKPEAALVEKIINSVDAVLMAECISREIPPESDASPRSIWEALETYFKIPEGKLNFVSATRRTELAQNISLVATGAKTNPCYSIIDLGEGQTPNKMPLTLLSIGKSNKLRIPFVQGKFNMGGTGVFQFCGRHNLQLIISKRHPMVADVEAKHFGERDDSAHEWGFTVIRRDDPSLGVKNSTYRYLAPGEHVFRFNSDGLPILPGDYPEPYERQLQWGTVIKLYEYEMPGLKTNILFDLYNRLSLLMPTLALPIRLYERREGYTGRSLETTLAGLTVRLIDDRNQNVEEGFPYSSDLVVNGQEIAASIFVFKRGGQEKFKKHEGILFVVNGQTHGAISKAFFSRRSVDMSYLADSLLIVLDCSKFDGRSREDLFMNSRDRLRDGELKSAIETRLESLIKTHEGLQALKQRRRQEDIGDKLKESKPLADVLSEMMKKSPTLSKLFLEGVRLPHPFNLVSQPSASEEYVGAKFPTYFELIDLFPIDHPKYCAINRGFRIRYRTDAANDYFSRPDDRGNYFLQANGVAIENRDIALWNGTATLTGFLPLGVNVDDLLHFVSEVTDSRPKDPFNSDFYITVGQAETKLPSRTGGKKSLPSSDENGKAKKSSSRLALPNVIEVERAQWELHGFNENSALLVQAIEGGYDFYINVHNIHLLTELKADVKNTELLKARYEYGLVLVGLALLQQSQNGSKKDAPSTDGEDIYEKIKSVSQAISPFLLPMIATLGDLSTDESSTGEEELT